MRTLARSQEMKSNVGHEMNRFLSRARTRPHTSRLGIFIAAACCLSLGFSSRSTVAQSIQITAGGVHTCAHLRGKETKCWGSNGSGQLGNNSTLDSSLPVSVSGLPSTLAVIKAGGNHTCAITIAGAVKCWGSNSGGELGIVPSTNSPTPVDVPTLDSGVVAVALGAHHTCALSSTGGVKCWGYNNYGQLGNNSTTDAATPTDVTGITSGAIAISAGPWHTCAVVTGGGVKCWGDNFHGQLGNDSFAGSTVPVGVVGLSKGAVAVAGSEFHSCALTASGGVKCWGRNSSGSLGNNSTTSSAIPVDVIGLTTGVTHVAVAGSGYSCALTSGGGVKCWGYNEDGNLGNNSLTNSSIPVDVTDLRAGVSAIAIGGGHTCALTIASELKCWGYNGFGQLGNSSTISSRAPVAVIGLNVSASSTPKVAMIEYYYGQLNYYFITSRASDKSLLDSAVGWVRAGKAFPVLANRETNSSPITRFYFDQIAQNKSRGSHFYTLLPEEVAAVQALNPTNQPAPGKPFNEGIDSYAYLPSPLDTCASGQAPVYRLFRGNARFPDDPNHRFTIELSTYNSFVALGWDGEGVKFCVPQ